MMKIGSLVVLLVAMAMASSNCVNSNGSNESNISHDNDNQNQNMPRTTITQEEVDQNRSKWRKLGSADYDMTVSLWTHGFTPPANSVDIKVRKGKFVSIKVADKTGTDYTVHYRYLHTIEDVFDRISMELGRNSWVKAEFDPELGYPTSIDVTPRLSNANYRVRITRVDLVKLPD
ncbi:MAG: hypothetical protein IPJ30_03985 [Acidobacteria bacterium]|nr:hypothetical protein [Acidobacteriota bacterium]